MCMSQGIPDDFSKFIYADWSTREGKDAGGVSVAFLPYCRKRWTREQNEWKDRTHNGNKSNGHKSCISVDVPFKSHKGGQL